ncbi:MAG: DNA processing protein DprA [Deltaproteobacteria bacterium]|nr:DNA processing protein DprA [Deltaproteobacteria bacterium]
MTKNTLKPEDSEQVWSWLALSLISGIGYKKIRELIEQLGSVEELLKTKAEILTEQFQITSKLAGLITNATQSHSFKIEKRIIAETPGIRLFCPVSKGYPLRLQHISTPPTVLYWKGTLQDAESPCLAFVGSRGCTAYGKQQTRRLIKELSLHVPDIIIVSGLAKGIDTVAHETALECGLRTIAVLAGGLKHIYPPENKKLAEEITKNGALVSEFPLGVKPLARNFPIRNRVISGLSMGIVVTEARKNSGAKITAAFALEQNREVFAVPGRVDSAASTGTNSLIARQHAKLVCNAEDILEELSLISVASNQQQLKFERNDSGAKKINPDDLGEMQSRILKALNDGVEEIDAIHAKTELEMNILLATLLELELTGTVENIGGQIYRLAVELDIPAY